MTVFGVHVGLQHTTANELRGVWRQIEDLGFGWISVWDHFYGATGRPDDAACLEAVAMHAALACTTSKVRIGSLVYSIGYRHPAVLAKAITTIDQLSDGRADMGIGAGWAGPGPVRDALVRSLSPNMVVVDSDDRVIEIVGDTEPKA